MTSSQAAEVRPGSVPVTARVRPDQRAHLGGVLRERRTDLDLRPVTGPLAPPVRRDPAQPRDGRREAAQADAHHHDPLGAGVGQPGQLPGQGRVAELQEGDRRVVLGGPLVQQLARLHLAGRHADEHHGFEHRVTLPRSLFETFTGPFFLFRCKSDIARRIIERRR